MIILQSGTTIPWLTINCRILNGCVQEVEGPFRCNGGVKSIILNKKKIIPSNPEPAKPSTKAGNRHAN